MLSKYGLRGGVTDTEGKEQTLNDFVCLYLENGKLTLYAEKENLLKGKNILSPA